MDGGADEACGDEELGTVPEGTDCFSLRRCGSFDRTALELDTENWIWYVLEILLRVEEDIVLTVGPLCLDFFFSLQEYYCCHNHRSQSHDI